MTFNMSVCMLAQAEVMAFGGDGDAEPRPQLVLSSKWWFVRSAETRTVQVRICSHLAQLFALLDILFSINRVLSHDW